MKTYSLSSSRKIKLNDLLQEQLPLKLNKEVSNSKIRRLILAGVVFVNGKQIRIPAYTVFSGSSVEVEIDEDKLFFEKQPDDIQYELTEKDVLFEDENIIVVNKPSHFPSEAGMVASRDNLHEAVKRYLFRNEKKLHPNLVNLPYAGIMHRLDRDTSGVILFTKRREVNVFCHDMFENHLVQKEYLAVCCGIPQKDNFTVNFDMGRVSPKGQAAKWGKLSKEKGGVSSKTDFSVIQQLKNIQGCLIKCFLHTGRTHQIRVHLSSENLPILGDELYGGRTYGRIMLHACSLKIIHPVSKQEMKIEAPLPEEFNKILEG